MTATLGMPDRTLDQRMLALRQANAVRIYRSQLKRDVHDGLVLVSTVLGSVDRMTASMPIHGLLLAQPMWGRSKVDKLLFRCRVAPSKTVGGLSPRQRAALIAALMERGR